MSSNEPPDRAGAGGSVPPAPPPAPSGPQREDRWDRRTRRDFLTRAPDLGPGARRARGRAAPSPVRSPVARLWSRPGARACVALVALAILVLGLALRAWPAARPERCADTAPPDTFDAHASTVASAPDVGAQLGPSGAPTSSAAGAARVRAPRAPRRPNHRPWDGRRIVNPWE
jgi:hypothetical protein